MAGALLRHGYRKWRAVSTADCEAKDNSANDAPHRIGKIAEDPVDDELRCAEEYDTVVRHRGGDTGYCISIAGPIGSVDVLPLLILNTDQRSRQHPND